LSYISLHKTQLLDTLESQVLYSDLSSVVLADKGMGKSFFLKQLHTRLEQQVYISQIEAGVSLTSEQIEKSICLQLGLSWQDSEQSLLQKIEQTLAQRVLLTIDDAHLLSVECLNFLLSIAHPKQATTEKKVFLVLTGESSLAKKLNQTILLKQTPNLCVVFELQPLELEEIKPMIADFEAIKVSKAESLFDQQKLEYFWQLSQGNSAELKKQLTRWQIETDSLAQKISVQEKLPIKEKTATENVQVTDNVQASNSVKITERPEQTEPTAVLAKPKKALNNIWLIIGYSFIALLLVLALIYQDVINQQIMPKNNETNSSENKANENLNAQNQQPTLNSQKPKRKVDDLEQDKRASINQALDAKSTDIEAEKKTNIKLKQTSADKGLVLNDSVNAQNMTTNDDSLISDKKLESAIENTVEIEQQPKAESTTKSKNTLAERNKEDIENSIKLSVDEQLLLAQAPDKFTLQWLVVSKLDSANSFIARHPLKDSMRIFRRKQNQSYLFIVISGEYNSHIDADNARATYILRGYQGKPWIKAFSAIISDIKQLN
jgi:septal ring-binding cell division protein DamX